MSDLSGFRVAVLATDGFEESELTEPVKALRAAGARPTIVSPKAGEIQGVRHDIDKTIRVPVDRTLADVRVEEFDGVLLPGGALNADAMRMLPEVQSFLRDTSVLERLCAPLCDAVAERDGVAHVRKLELVGRLHIDVKGLAEELQVRTHRQAGVCLVGVR